MILLFGRQFSFFASRNLTKLRLPETLEKKQMSPMIFERLFLVSTVTDEVNFGLKLLVLL